MGLDAKIQFEFSGTDAQVNDLAFDLARRANFDSVRHPAITRELRYSWDESSDVEREWLDPAICEVNMWSSFFGPGYERGSWPDLRAILSVLMAWQRQEKIGLIWYFGDSTDRSGVGPFTTETLAVLDHHFDSGFWNYRWRIEEKLLDPDPLPVGCRRPSDAYGKPMRRQGWGRHNTWALFRSTATGEEVEFGDGKFVAKQDAYGKKIPDPPSVSYSQETEGA